MCPKRHRAVLQRILPRVCCLTCPHSEASGGNHTKHPRCTSMGDESRCTSENCKKNTLRMTRSPIIYVSCRLRAQEGKSSDQQGSLLQSTRSERLSAMSTFERAHCVDISLDNCSRPNLAVLRFRDAFDGSARLKEIMRNPTFNFIRINDISIFVAQMFRPASRNARTRSPVSSRVKEELRTSKKQSLVSPKVICTVSDLSRIMRRSRGQ